MKKIILVLFLFNICSCISYNRNNFKKKLLKDRISISIIQKKWIIDDRWKYNSKYKRIIFEKSKNVRPYWDNPIKTGFQKLFPHKNIIINNNQDSDFTISIETHVSRYGKIYILVRILINDNKKHTQLGNVIGYYVIEVIDTQNEIVSSDRSVYEILKEYKECFKPQKHRVEVEEKTYNWISKF